MRQRRSVIAKMLVADKGADVVFEFFTNLKNCESGGGGKKCKEN